MSKNMKQSIYQALRVKYIQTDEKQDSSAIYEREFTNHNPYGSNRVIQTRRRV